MACNNERVCTIKNCEVQHMVCSLARIARQNGFFLVSGGVKIINQINKLDDDSLIGITN